MGENFLKVLTFLLATGHAPSAARASRAKEKGDHNMGAI